MISQSADSAFDEGSGLFCCKSGEHYWRMYADAVKCCNGWTRESRATFDDPDNPRVEFYWEPIH